jgi:hypothetical protein
MTRKTSSNRENGKRSTGPKNTTVTRYNARKHALLSSGITELDDVEGYPSISARIKKNSMAERAAFLEERVAVGMVRAKRVARLEAEYITSILHPTIRGKIPGFDTADMKAVETPILDPGLPARISADHFESLMKMQRYETSIDNKLYRDMHELERVQRLSKGEPVPAPAALDVTIHGGAVGTNAARDSKDSWKDPYPNAPAARTPTPAQTVEMHVINSDNCTATSVFGDCVFVHDSADSLDSVARFILRNEANKYCVFNKTAKTCASKI